jgi:hypothetical protein
VRSLRETQTLINPIMVDADRRLLIDGHHRVAAFLWLGLTRIPAFIVDYSSPFVAVSGWSRATTATPIDVQEAFALPGIGPPGPWTVAARDVRQGILARRAFGTAKAGARYLDRISLYLTDGGHSLNLVASDQPVQRDRIHTFIDPVVGKAEVLQAAEEGWLFPYEVNRHLIEDRPLGMSFPLASLTDDGAFVAYLDAVFNERPPRSTPPGFRQAGRIYEERTVLFSTPEDSDG